MVFGGVFANPCVDRYKYGSNTVKIDEETANSENQSTVVLSICQPRKNGT